MQTDASLLPDQSSDSENRTVNGVDLHVVTAGDSDGQLVVLLHGFPDFWYGWHEQIGPLVEAGYRVLVPDQRGYNLSEIPRDLDSYRISTLSGDIAALIRSEGRESAHVVGHDWGAMVAWDLALRRPEVVNRLSIVNVPHPSAFRTALQSSADQLRRSWYALAFQLPVLPEWVLARADYRILESALRASGSTATFFDSDIERYRESWRQAGTVTGMLNWYRAAGRRPERPPRETVSQPTLILWGENDVALMPDLATMSRQYCPNGRIERFPNLSHWAHLEAPEAVSELLLTHLQD